MRQSFGIVHKRLRQLAEEQEKDYTENAVDDETAHRPIMQPASSKDIKMSPHTLYATKPSVKSIPGVTPGFGGSKARLRSGHNRTVNLKEVNKLGQVLGTESKNVSESRPEESTHKLGQTTGVLYKDKSDLNQEDVA